MVVRRLGARWVLLGCIRQNMLMVLDFSADMCVLMTDVFASVTVSLSWRSNFGLLRVWILRMLVCDEVLARTLMWGVICRRGWRVVVVCLWSSLVMLRLLLRVRWTLVCRCLMAGGLLNRGAMA